MRIVKSFSHENRFLNRLHAIRKKELNGIRTLLIIRSMNNAIAFSLPIIASVISFIVYKAAGNDLNPANIFSALTLFQLLRMPLMFLPLSFSASTDAWNAFERLDTVFYSEQLEDTSERLDVQDAKNGLEIIDASFTWDQVERVEDIGKGLGGKKAKKDKKLKGRLSLSGSTIKNESRRTSKEVSQNQVERTDLQQDHNEATVNDQAVGPNPDEARKLSENELAQVDLEEEDMVRRDQGLIDQDDGGKERNENDLDTTDLPKHGQVSGLGSIKGFMETTTEKALSSQVSLASNPSIPPPFTLNHINLTVPVGELIAITGKVGSGKSSLLQACIGEMRKTGGRVIWGGKKIGYSAQSSWIQNCSVRDNILFGQEWDEEKYWNVIKLAELESDLKMLQNGDLAMIGERGKSQLEKAKARFTSEKVISPNPLFLLQSRHHPFRRSETSEYTCDSEAVDVEKGRGQALD